ncbi:MAG: CHASE3 domain-containing protein [Rubrivivax sp.]|nr:CHASE3 domain-containing protein [Rubrivivax sp.]
MDALKRFKHLKDSPIVFPLACVAAVAMVFISEGSYWQSVDTLNELGAMGAARTSLQTLQQSIVDAEAGQRGYLLTGRPEHLRPYDQALKNISASFDVLDRHYTELDDAAAVLDKLHTLTAAKVTALARTIREHAAGQVSSGTDIVLNDINREQMDAIRALAGELLEHEARNVRAGRDDLYRTLMVSRTGIAALSAISLLALYLFLRQSAALRRQQLDIKRTVQAERDRLDAEVKRRTVQLTELTHHLQTAREDERSRLARNLHDELGALLTSAKLDAARIRSRLAGTAPEALERLAHLVDTLNKSIALGRSIIEDLRPSTLANLGLVATLEILAREFAERSGVQVHSTLAPVKLDAAAELMVYRLVQEAITNVSKYAKARSLWLRLAADAGRVEVSVRDDGIGFDTAAPPRSAYGLVGMRFRVEAEGGTLTVLSAPGQGTHVRATLPELGASADEG